MRRKPAHTFLPGSPGLPPSFLAGTESRAQRAFLGRTVRYLVAEAGIRQLLDIGTGMPAARNIHQVAQCLAPECRIVYVDKDPVVLSHARALLKCTREGATAYIDAELMGATAPGSYVTIAHPATDLEPEAIAEFVRRYNELAAGKARFRTHPGICRFFDGLELVEPDVVKLPTWRPDSEFEARCATAQWAGMARKR